MNKPLSDSDLATPKVTTGPIAGSRKIFSVPDAAPDLRVPLREIPLSEGSGEEPVRVYDPSGPYTDNDVAIDVETGLKRARIAWVITLTCVDTALVPQMTTQSALAISRGSGPMSLPVPAMKPGQARLTQIVEKKPE